MSVVLLLEQNPCSAAAALGRAESFRTCWKTGDLICSLREEGFNRRFFVLLLLFYFFVETPGVAFTRFWGGGGTAK